MTMTNRMKHLALLGTAQAILSQQELMAANSHCADPLGCVIEPNEMHEYKMAPMPTDAPPATTPTGNVKKPRSKYTPHVGAKELRRKSHNTERTRR